MGIVGSAWVAGWAADYGGRQANVLDGAGDDRRGVCRGCREDGIVVSTVPWVVGMVERHRSRSRAGARR